MTESLQDRPTRVLFVCLGNICRSPTAEGVLRHLLAQRSDTPAVEVDSAGTGDYHIGEPPDQRSQQAARKRGIEIGDLRARQVGVEDFARFDLVLAMDESNLRYLQALRPAGAHARLQLFMDYAPQPHRADIPDPYLGSERDFDQVLDLSAAAARGLSAALRARAGRR